MRAGRSTRWRYAQFNRAFRSRFGKSPREYLFDHRPRPGREANA
jgi:hypothetical protein